MKPHRGPATIAGWQITETTDDAIHLTRTGRHLHCELLVVTTPDATHLALAVAYCNNLGATIWRRVAPTHRRLGATLLRKAWLQA